MKVFRKLAMVYLANRSCKASNPEAHDKSFDSLLRFQKVVKTKEVKQEIDTFVKGFKSQAK